MRSPGFDVMLCNDVQHLLHPIKIGEGVMEVVLCQVNSLFRIPKPKILNIKIFLPINRCRLRLLGMRANHIKKQIESAATTKKLYDTVLPPINKLPSGYNSDQELA